MELTKVQSLALFTVVTVASTKDETIELDFKPSEASKVQTELLEFIEEHGEGKAEELLKQAFTDATRALYNGIISTND